jgi:hypothetical protein
VQLGQLGLMVDLFLLHPKEVGGVFDQFLIPVTDLVLVDLVFAGSS